LILKLRKIVNALTIIAAMNPIAADHKSGCHSFLWSFEGISTSICSSFSASFDKGRYALLLYIKTLRSIFDLRDVYV